MQSVSRVSRRPEKDTSIEDIKESVQGIIQGLDKTFEIVRAVNDRMKLLENNIKISNDALEEDLMDLSKMVDESIKTDHRSNTLRVACSTMSITILGMLVITDPSNSVLFLGLTAAAIGAVVSMFSKK